MDCGGCREPKTGQLSGGSSQVHEVQVAALALPTTTSQLKTTELQQNYTEEKWTLTWKAAGLWQLVSMTMGIGQGDAVLHAVP